MINDSLIREQFMNYCSGVGFAKVHNITVKGGNPFVTKETTAVRTVVFDREIGRAKHSPKREVCFPAFFRECVRIGDGTILELELKDGVPAHMRVSA